MQSLSLVVHNPIVSTSITFPEILFQTENVASFSLSFFTQKNLCHIIDNLASLSTKKANSFSLDSKALHILNIEKIVAKLGDDLSLDYGSYMQAMEQYICFQIQHSVDAEWTDI